MIVRVILAVILVVDSWAIQGGNYPNAFPAGALYGPQPSSVHPQNYQFHYKPIETSIFQPQPFGPSARQGDYNDYTLSNIYPNYIQQSDPNTLFQLQNQMIQELMQYIQMYQSNNQPQVQYPSQLPESQSSSTQFYSGSQSSNIQPFLQMEYRLPVPTDMKTLNTPQLPELILPSSSSRDSDQLFPKDTSPISTNEIIDQLQSGLNNKDLSAFSSNPSELSSLLATLANQSIDYTDENPLIDRGVYHNPSAINNDNSNSPNSKAILTSRKMN